MIIFSVSLDGKVTSVERADRPVEFRKNGDYVDVHFTKDGRSQWIGIRVSDLRKIMRRKKDGSQVSGHAQYDEALND